MMVQSTVPQHVAIIMDGNGRWARQRNKHRSYGHLQGLKRVNEIIEVAQKSGIKVLTLFAFSSENWSRPADEVNLLMRALISHLKKNIKKLNEGGICFRTIGQKKGIPKEVWDVLSKAQQQTKLNMGMVLNLAFNYGSRQEIVDATKNIACQVRRGEIDPDSIDQELFSQCLYTQGLPDPDLLIRTSGEQRVSNFLLWQISYCELYFTQKHWPDFNAQEFAKALSDFESRERRYGSVVHTRE
jgi:undecaprenyl diphosphate synthase